MGGLINLKVNANLYGAYAFCALMILAGLWKDVMGLVIVGVVFGSILLFVDLIRKIYYSYKVINQMY